MDQVLILDFILTFIMFLYGESTYPRKIVQEVVDFLDSFIRNVFLRSLRNDIIFILKSNGVSDVCLVEIETCISVI